MTIKQGTDGQPMQKCRHPEGGTTAMHSVYYLFSPVEHSKNEGPMRREFRKKMKNKSSHQKKIPVCVHSRKHDVVSELVKASSHVRFWQLVRGNAVEAKIELGRLLAGRGATVKIV